MKIKYIAKLKRGDLIRYKSFTNLSRPDDIGIVLKQDGSIISVYWLGEKQTGSFAYNELEHPCFFRLSK